MRQAPKHTAGWAFLGLCAIGLAAAHGVALAQATKKPNILIIWGDDIGQSNLSVYQGPDGLPDAEHRSDRHRGLAVHRLLRRAELHGGPRGLHHGPERVSLGPLQGRSAGG